MANMANISGLRTLSSRGETAAKATLPAALDVISDLFSKESNPAGFISLGLAENVWTNFWMLPTEQRLLHDS
jgi:hypothetical protein